MLRVVLAELVKGEEATLGAKAGTLVAGMIVEGAKAETAAKAAARRRMLNLDIVSIYILYTIKRNETKPKLVRA